MKFSPLLFLIAFFCVPLQVTYAATSTSSSEFLNNFIEYTNKPIKEVSRKVVRKDAQLHILSTVATKAAKINAPVSSNTYNIDISLSNVIQYVSTSTRDYNLEKKFTVKLTKSGDKRIDTYFETSKVRKGKQLDDYIRAGRDALEVTVPDSVLGKLTEFEQDSLSRYINSRIIKVSRNIDDQILTTQLTDSKRVDFFMKTLLSVVYVKNDFGIEQYEYPDVVSIKTGKPKSEYAPARHIQVGISVTKLKEAILKVYRSDIKPKNLTRLDYVRLINFFDSVSFSNLAEGLTIDFWINPETYEVYKMDMPSTSISFQDELISVDASVDFSFQDKKISQGTVINTPSNSLDYLVLKKKIDVLLKKKKAKTGV